MRHVVGNQESQWPRSENFVALSPPKVRWQVAPQPTSTTQHLPKHMAVSGFLAFLAVLGLILGPFLPRRGNRCNPPWRQEQNEARRREAYNREAQQLYTLRRRNL